MSDDRSVAELMKSIDDRSGRCIEEIDYLHKLIDDMRDEQATD